MAENNAECASNIAENANDKQKIDINELSTDEKNSDTIDERANLTEIECETNIKSPKNDLGDTEYLKLGDTVDVNKCETSVKPSEVESDAAGCSSESTTDVKSVDSSQSVADTVRSLEKCNITDDKDKESSEGKLDSPEIEDNIETSDIDSKAVEVILESESDKTADITEIKPSQDESNEKDEISIVYSSEGLSKEKTVTIKTEIPKDDRKELEEVSIDDRSRESVDDTLCEEEEKLKEILKIVHNDLDIKNLPKSAQRKDHSMKKKESKDETNEEKKIIEVDLVDDVDEDSSVNKDNASISLENARLNQNLEAKDETEKFQEQSEVGIVGPPTAVSELINEEELRSEPTANEKVQDHVAEWIQNSAKNEVIIVNESEERENENIRNNDRHRRKNRKKKAKKKKGINFPRIQLRKSQRIAVCRIIKRSIKCLNKMHAMDSAGGNGKKVDSAEKTREDDASRASPKVPQSQQNGAALPEETAAAGTTAVAADRLRASSIKKEPNCDSEPRVSTKNHSPSESTLQKSSTTRSVKTDTETGRKRKSSDVQHSSNRNSSPKKLCLEQREQYISSLVGLVDKVTAEELATRAEQLRAEVHALDKLARATEMEWNEILSMRKLKEEAYLRIERKRQVMGFIEGNGQLSDSLPPASLALSTEWESSGNTTPVSKEKCGFESKEDIPDENSEDLVATFKKEKGLKSSSQRQSTPPKPGSENGRKQQSEQALSPENRQIGEGRQGAIVDVRSIIADYRLRHPETVPRRGRRMRNSVNVGLGAGGGVVETGHNVDSRPSSTDSCKSNPNASDSANSMSFKDVLVQFAKLSQQQGEPVKTPQNYPDVTLHPVAPAPVPQNTPSQQTGSLLHGILTKSQSPRPTTFSPTLARLLTAPERERNAPTATSTPQQAAATQHLLQAYQGSNPVSISDLLSSSKARTEITITPVVNTSVQSHSNNLIHVDDVEEETAVIEDRETRVSSGGRDARDDRDSPPRCQGCHERAAQFVCAGCGNQWYCSRECQVAAWDEHSEVCSG